MLSEDRRGRRTADSWGRHRQQLDCRCVTIPLPFPDRLIHGQMPAEITDLLLQAFGAEEVTDFCMGFDDAKLDVPLRQLPMQAREHVRAGDIDKWRSGKIAYDEQRV
jgi:hypothetical protein